MYEVIRYYRQIESISSVASLPWWLTDSTADLSFSDGRYYDGTSTLTSPTSLITTSRASTGYATNADGTMTSFANDTPRIGIGTGLLVEEARTNNILQSQTFDSASWTKGNGTITADQIVAPDGTTTADLFTEDTSSNAHYFFGNNFTANLNDVLTVSVYLKNGTRQFVSVRGENTTGAANNYAWITADLVNGTIAANADVTTSSIDTLANGWYRVKFTFTINPAVVTSGNIVIAGSDVATAPVVSSALGNSYVGTSKTFYAWGAQAELGSFATSYIPTTTVAVTRAADVVTLTGAAQTALQGAAWSYVLSFGPMANAATAGARLIGDSTTQFVAYFSTAGSINAFPGGNQVGVVATVSNKLAQAQSGTTQSMTINGGLISSSPVLDGVPTLPYVGSEPGSAWADGYFKRLSLFNTRLSDATLQAYSI